jgi:hypothetical protein
MAAVRAILLRKYKSQHASLAFYDFYFFFGQVVKLVNRLVYFFIGLRKQLLQLNGFVFLCFKMCHPFGLLRQRHFHFFQALRNFQFRSSTLSPLAISHILLLSCSYVIVAANDRIRMRNCKFRIAGIKICVNQRENLIFHNAPKANLSPRSKT